MSSTADKRPALSETQRRNRRWMAEHGVVTTLVPAVFFGVLGLRYGSDHADDVSWLNAPVAGVVWAVFGALIGYGISSECRDPKPTAARRALVIAVAVLCIAIVGFMRYVRYTT